MPDTLQAGRPEEMIVMDAQINCLHEIDLDAATHERLKALLYKAFAQNSVRPKGRSYFCQQPHMRLTYSKDDIVGHLAIYLRVIKVAGQMCETMAIGDVAVSPAYRRQGIANALLDSAIEIARRSEVEFMWLFGSSSLYERAGFKTNSSEVIRLDVITGQLVKNNKHNFRICRLSNDISELGGPIDLLGPAL